MKALILAAGFGTRLQPYSLHTPKPLFTINGQTLLDRIIRQLKNAGCQEIIINTHHLADQIDAFITMQAYRIPVHTRQEPQILGTGGAIKNVADFWDDTPFIVINSDIFTDIDIRQVYDFHLQHTYPATLVLFNCEAYNTVTVSDTDMIIGFDISKDMDSAGQSATRLTFTGIQVINPELLALIPADIFYNSIDVYNSLIAKGKGVKAYRASQYQWRDIGTLEAYWETALEQTSAAAFAVAFPDSSGGPIMRTRLAGDGSDRKWYRISRGANTLILADHGIRSHGNCSVNTGISEIDSFIDIGRHLLRKGCPVPRIHHYDDFAGLVFMEDLGDENLQQKVKQTPSIENVRQWYKTIIKLLIGMSVKGKNGMDRIKTYQTACYDKQMIIERECRYFVDAFLAGCLDIKVEYSHLAPEFDLLAEGALKNALIGFMHRDFQSRNIMVRADRFYFIDFQGGRLGPLQYDLASLLIDPYVALSFPEQNELVDYAAHKAQQESGFDKDNFRQGFYYCALTRNLQILGAFGFLSTVKGKRDFAQYIPRAIESLGHYLDHPDITPLPNLKGIFRRIESRCYDLEKKGSPPECVSLMKG